MNIYKVKLTEQGQRILFNTYFGVAETIEDAMRYALETEQAAYQDTVDLAILSAELIAECAFMPNDVALANAA